MSVSYEHFSASSNSDTSNFKMVRTKMLNLRLHILMSGFKVVISSFYLHTMVGFILTPLAADLMVWLSINIIKFALSFSYLRSIRYLRWIVTKAEEVYLLDGNIAHKCLWFRRLYSLQVFLWFKRKKIPFPAQLTEYWQSQKSSADPVMKIALLPVSVYILDDRSLVLACGDEDYFWSEFDSASSRVELSRTTGRLFVVTLWFLPLSLFFSSSVCFLFL